MKTQLLNINSLYQLQWFVNYNMVHQPDEDEDMLAEAPTAPPTGLAVENVMKMKTCARTNSPLQDYIIAFLFSGCDNPNFF